MKTKKKPKFTYKFNYNDYLRRITQEAARRVGPFIETYQKGRHTFIVDFQLAGGYFYGWTLWDISGAGVEAVESLLWILKANFPDEVKNIIMDHLEKRKLIGQSKEYWRA